MGGDVEATGRIVVRGDGLQVLPDGAPTAMSKNDIYLI